MVSYTNNIRLKIPDNATSDTKYNLTRIDELFTWQQTTQNGLKIFTSANGFLFRPLLGLPGGQVSFGEQGAEMTAFKVFGPMWGRSITLQASDCDFSTSISPSSLQIANIAWKLPAEGPTDGQLLGFSGIDGQMTLIDPETVGVQPTGENEIVIGSPLGAQQVNTLSIGDVLASAADGLTIKDGKIVNAHIGEPISMDNLAAMSAGKILITDENGHIKASTLAESDLPTAQDPMQALISPAADVVELSDITNTDELYLALGKLRNRINAIVIPPALTLDEGKIFIGDSNNLPSEHSISGDIAMDVNGAVTVNASIKGGAFSTIETSNWADASNGTYELTIPVATHGQGINVLVQTFAEGSQVLCENVTVSGIGDVTLTVSDLPDGRFQGKCLIKRI